MSRRRTSSQRDDLLAQLGAQIAGFQAAAEDVDEAAARALALERNELRCLDRLREGPQVLSALASRLDLGERAFKDLVSRLELAGYARRVTGATDARRTLLELTPHADRWTESLYGPIRQEGFALLGSYDLGQLRLLVRFLRAGCRLQERHARRLRALNASGSGQVLKNRPRGGLSPAALRRVQLYVAANLERPLPIERLAERAGLSAYHFARAFKATHGQTPHRFVHEQRVERAGQLLREGQLSLAQIALACGFSSQSRLTTAFRKATGTTPARYRRGTGA